MDDDFIDVSIGQFNTKQAFYNNMEESISLIEKTSKKLLPIYQEVLRKIAEIEKRKSGMEEASNMSAFDLEGESSDIDDSKIEVDTHKKKGAAKKKEVSPAAVDLRHILGFLNQTEWIQNLNIGNIMQISPLRLDDLLQLRRNEEALSRENFLEVISFLIVGYFCASTEIRFIIQLKDEIQKFDSFKIDKKT